MCSVPVTPTTPWDSVGSYYSLSGHYHTFPHILDGGIFLSFWCAVCSGMCWAVFLADFWRQRQNTVRRVLLYACALTSWSSSGQRAADMGPWAESYVRWRTPPRVDARATPPLCLPLRTVCGKPPSGHGLTCGTGFFQTSPAGI